MLPLEHATLREAVAQSSANAQSRITVVFFVAHDGKM